jgi:phosphatidylserine synthase
VRDVVDAWLRPVKARLYAPLTRGLRGVDADAVTIAGGVVGLAAAVAAALGHFEIALAGWLANRALDGLDGELARAGRRAPNPAGAYLDLMVDLIVYTALTIGIAIGVAAAGAEGGIWPATALLLGAYYLNLGSWALLSAALPPTRDRPHAPGLRMPAGLIEGAETIVAYAVILALPQHAVLGMLTFALLTLAGAIARAVIGWRRLRAAAASRHA